MAARNWAKGSASLCAWAKGLTPNFRPPFTVPGETVPFRPASRHEVGNVADLDAMHRSTATPHGSATLRGTLCHGSRDSGVPPHPDTLRHGDGALVPLSYGRSLTREKIRSALKGPLRKESRLLETGPPRIETGSAKNRSPDLRDRTA